MTVETLSEYGLREMDDESIRNVLRNRGVGMLGLPTDGAPYLLPIAFGYGGGERLYFNFFVGETSRKVALSEAADVASFLVYTADSPFSWESVNLEGSIDELPAEEWDAHDAAMSNAWRLDVFERADTAGEVRVFVFTIEERHGYRYAEVPSGFEPTPT